MTKEKIWKFFLLQCANICIEFCTDFDEDATNYNGFLVFKDHVEYLDSLKHFLFNESDINE